jgi:hypothetical protein
MKRSLGLFLSKSSIVIVVYTICTDHEGKQANYLSIKYTLSIKHAKSFFEGAPKKTNKKKSDGPH